jgi:A/G-specific adenine glycosylase
MSTVTHGAYHHDIPAELPEIQATLLDWFRRNGRDLPWRHTRDPYRILVSEVMLQQTQVERVIPKYHAFLERFPTVHALAEAPTAEVILLWAGLGYNRRAVNLQRAARAVVEEHGGAFPQDVTILEALPGIGPYTAGAVACFAFEQDVGFMDTNIKRLLHRLFLGPEIPEQRRSDREMNEITGAIIPEGQGWVWNQALIEFGALQCTSRKPACLTCPLQRHCRAFPEIQTVLADAYRNGFRRKNEASFHGSSRYYRGRVVATLRNHDGPDGVAFDQIGPLIRDDFTHEHQSWLEEIIAGLKRDGLVEIAEDRLAYDATDTGTPRLRLSGHRSPEEE